MECKSHKVLFQINNNVFELYFEEDRIKEYHPIQLYFENPQTPIDLSEYMLEECEINDIKDIIESHYNNYGYTTEFEYEYPLTTYNILSYLTSSNQIEFAISNIKILIDIFTSHNYIIEQSFNLNIPQMLKEYLEKNHKNVNKTIIRKYYYQWLSLIDTYTKYRYKFDLCVGIQIKYLYDLSSEYNHIKNINLFTKDIIFLYNNDSTISLDKNNLTLLRYFTLLSPRNTLNIYYYPGDVYTKTIIKIPIKNIRHGVHYVGNNDFRKELQILFDEENKTIDIIYSMGIGLIGYNMKKFSKILTLTYI